MTPTWLIACPTQVSNGYNSARVRNQVESGRIQVKFDSDRVDGSRQAASTEVANDHGSIMAWSKYCSHADLEDLESSQMDFNGSDN